MMLKNQVFILILIYTYTGTYTCTMYLFIKLNTLCTCILGCIVYLHLSNKYINHFHWSHLLRSLTRVSISRTVICWSPSRSNTRNRLVKISLGSPPVSILKMFMNSTKSIWSSLLVSYSRKR